MREIFFSEELVVPSFMNEQKSAGFKRIIQQERLKEKKKWMIKLRKQKYLMMIMIMIFLCIIAMIPVIMKFSSMYQERASIPKVPDGMEKVYGEIEIEKGDTLTSISKKIIDIKKLGSYYRIQDMKYEIALINAIYDKDMIYQDDKLIFPYYIYNMEDILLK